MLDHVVIIIYLVATLAIGFVAGKKTKTFSDFAIGKRNISMFALLAAIMASIVDASETIDYASEVMNEGLVYCFAYLGAGFSSLALSFFFASRFDRFLGRAFSTGDVIHEFFGEHAKVLVGIATLLETILFCATQILAISITVQYFFGIPGSIASVIISVITLLYFFRGGARSVNATDILQFGILIVALPIFCGIALSKIGGYSAVFSLIDKSGINFTAPEPASYGKSLTMLILFSLPGQYPLIIQRMLMAKNTTQLRRVLVWDAFIGTMLRIVVVTLGVAAFLLLPSNSDSNIPLLELASNLLPTGAKGLAVVGLLAIMMSTIDSTIHLGAVSLTQDIFWSRLRGTDDTKKLQHARYSSLFVIICAIIASLNFDKIGNLFYLLMAIGNCLIWPGIFLALTGVSSSKKGFWIGASIGVGALVLCMSAFDIDLLYVNLIATSTSLFAHVIYVITIEKRIVNILAKPIPPAYKNLRIRVLNKLRFMRIIKNKDYCSIFAALSIFLSIYPFFINNNRIDYQEASYAFPAFSLMIGFLAVTILFAEFWYHSFIRLYPIIWGCLVVLALPAQTYFMLINSDFAFIWIVDAILIVPLVATLSTKAASFIFHVTGIAIAIIAASTINFSYAHLPADFGYWSVLMHAMVLTLCFALFRKRDVELCRFEASTIAHETRRVLNTFESVAHFYDRRLPLLITPDNSKSQTDKLTSADLEILLSLPGQIQVLTERTRNLLTSCIDRISSYSNERTFTKRCSIQECILAAASDASLSERVRNAVQIDLESDLNVKGNKAQLIQVFINILENAGHAISSVDFPSIHINIMGNTVFITDNGCGINAAHLPNIFDEFFSTKSSNGQGLAFCKSVMLEHGGSILCTSQENNFTRFELRFPPAN